MPKRSPAIALQLDRAIDALLSSALHLRRFPSRTPVPQSRPARANSARVARFAASRFQSSTKIRFTKENHDERSRSSVSQQPSKNLLNSAVPISRTSLRTSS